MKVSLARHGGQAAGMLLGRAPKVLDATRLPEADAKDLARLVEAARSQAVGAHRGTRSAPDAMSYTITVEGGDQPTILKCSDVDMSLAFEDLLRFLERHLE